VKAVPRLDQVESLFHQALAVQPEDRLRWLEERCGADRVLFAEISSLLDAHAAMTSTAPLTQPRAGQAASDARPVPSGLFGAWKAVRLIGRGGMSSVYLAERADGQFDQTAALKVMAGFLAGPEFLHKFETERQLLASLNHNNITRLLDGGISASGDPFLVTEYVDGQSIDRYCDDRKLGVEVRLRVFLQVCDAVDYAHRNLIVHRDLKPANILVNAEGAVKLLDFGTASLATRHDVTVTRLRMLTPRYASPEQLRGARVNIATDVFSLGVVLYELLTGVWPFGDPASILRELDRCTGDAAAKPPSVTITEEAAKSRSMSREHLSRALKGDLSAIVLKALESDPSRRYESVRAFATDIGSFLDGRPVAARQQTTLYRAGKFLRRRWLPVSAAALFVLGLAGAAIVAVHQAQVARSEALKAQKVNEFLNGILSSPAQLTFDPQKFTVEQMLEAAETRVEKSWTGDALTEATLRRSLGDAYWAMSRFDRARAQLQKSLAIFQALGDEKEIAASLFDLSIVAGLEGRPADEVNGLEQVLEHTKRLGKNAPAHLVFQTEDQLGTTLWLVMNRRLSEARTLLDDALALGVRDLSIPRTGLALAMSHRAGLLGQEGKPEEAEVMYRKALTIGRRENPDGMWQTFPLHFLALLIAPRDLPAATEFARQYYQVCERAVGPDNAETAAAKLFWMRERAEGGNPGDVARQVLEAVEIVRKHYPPPSMNLWVSLSASVVVLNRLEQFKDAESQARELLPILDANRLPANDTRRAQSLLELGEALRGEKKQQEAADALRKSAAIYDAAGPTWAAKAELARKLAGPPAGATR
jgi:tetratricopeptide (TPR) repeat protein